MPQFPTVLGRVQAPAEHEWLESVIELSSEGILVIDAGGTLRSANKEARRQYGAPFDPRNPPSAVGWAANCSFLSAEGRTSTSAQSPVHQAARGDAVERTRFSVKRPDGSTRVLSGTSTALKARDGSHAATMFVTRDDTELVEMERRLRLQSTVLNNLRDSIIVTDLAGRIVQWSSGAEAVFGYREDEAVGHTPALLYPDLDTKTLALDLAKIVGGQDFVGEWKGRRKDGSVVWVEIKTTVMPDANGRPIGFIGIGKDVTARKTAELERAHADRERQSALECAELASRAKDEFLAMLGHELRNPLSPIVTALRLMKLKGETSPSKEQQVIERQVDHLVRLLDDLLDVSRITRGSFELKKERLDVAGVVAKAVEMAMPLLEQRQHHFHVDVHPMRLDADPARLAQVVANLLTNAAKYTERGGTISLNAWRDGGEVVIAVKDTGIGIPPEMLPRVFDLFIQGQRANDRAQGGLGIGLTLVQQLVRMHKGTVVASSEGAGKGSEFVVRLPALPEAGLTSTVVPLPPWPQAVDRAATPRRVLIVDDNSDAGELLAAMLRELGHDVRLAEDGPRALQLVERFVPEVALLDIGLPVMDGYELAKHLRRMLPPAVRFAAVTGYGQEHDRRRSAASGFDQHFVKPVDPDLIVSYVCQP